MTYRSFVPGVALPPNEAARDAWATLTAELNVQVRPLADFLNDANRQTLSLDQKLSLLAAARTLLRQSHAYPHLPYKQDVFGTDPKDGAVPLERLKGFFGIPDDPDAPLDPAKIAGVGDLDFHLALLDAFASVRDLHTVYFLPGAFRGVIAFLPFEVGFSVENGLRQYVVTRIMRTSAPGAFGDFQPGVRLLAWDNFSLDDAVRKAAALRPGANPDADALLGTALLTVRNISTSGIAAWGKPPFTSPITTKIHYQAASGAQRSIVLPWAVGSGFSAEGFIPGNAFSISQDVCEMWRAGKILWCREELEPVQKAAPDTVPHAVGVLETQFTGGTPVPGFVNPADLVSSQPGKQNARFAYLKIRAFTTQDLNPTVALVDTFRTVLADLDQKAPDGLILDIRSNPGGDIRAAEQLLQMLTPKPIEPALFHLANTPFIQDFLTTVPPDAVLGPWKTAAANPLPDGRLTAGFPITTREEANLIGQVYQGPVVLLTDALTYSAAEIFAGGFQDHGIGPIIGVDQTTGGGGANVWHYDELVTNFPTLALPPRGSGNDANMQVAIRRSSRPAASAGAAAAQPTRFIEDTGVVRDIAWDRQLEDMTSASSGLLCRACDELAKATIHRIDVHSQEFHADNSIAIALTPTNIDRLEFSADGSAPLGNMSVTGGVRQTVSVRFPVNPLLFSSLRIRGLSSGSLSPGPVAVVTVPLS